MKKLTALCLALLLLFTAQAADLSGMTLEELTALRAEVDEAIRDLGTSAVRPSDRYTVYLPNYANRNLASVGYTSMGGDRMERIGSAYLKLILVTEDGSFVDVEDETALTQYVIVDQSPAPDTEIKLEYLKDSDGEEYSNLTAHQSYETVELLLRRVGADAAPDAPKLSSTLPSPDRYTWYIRDYAGKCPACVGYTSMGGDRMDEYGHGRVKLVLLAEDGSYVDPEDEDALKQYVVTGQDVPPNTELRLTFLTDSDGEEYDNLVDTQSYESVTLYVEKRN